ncbi:hypothetical protein CHARACLAT_004582 [Characodon lateralis]|uniref:Uncharacterized protein n=1 Tax=Characodon lateralis TaxID=208331 RepID=A0ABU7D461_9TELE|nr:hypothetical protein [Characodon lateralis]
MKDYSFCPTTNCTFRNHGDTGPLSFLRTRLVETTSLLGTSLEHSCFCRPQRERKSSQQRDTSALFPYPGPTEE